MPVWPDMVDSFALFCRAPWTWVSLGMAGAMRVGIDLLQLEARARLIRIEITPAIFSDIVVMEEEAISVWSRKRGR